MTCKFCKKEMNFVSRWDDPNIGYCYNLQECVECGAIAKRDVWKNAGILWVAVDGEIEKDMVVTINEKKQESDQGRMKCKCCNRDMTGIGIHHGENLFVCDVCGTIARQDIQNNEKIIWIEIRHIQLERETCTQSKKSLNSEKPRLI